MQQKYLIVKGCAGLGNRISTLCAAIEYARDTNRTILVDWADGVIMPEGYNFFDDYFVLKNVAHVTSYEEIPNRDKLSFYPNMDGQDITSGTYHLFDQLDEPQHAPIPFHRLPKNKLRTLYRHWRVKHKKRTELPRRPWILFDDRVLPYGGDMSRRIKKDVVFYVDYIPSFSQQTVRENLRLSDPLEARIAAFVDQRLDGGKAVGVHVRSTDKKPDAEIRDLLAQVRQLAKDNTSIFLSTDNIVLQQELQQTLQNVHVYPKDLPQVTCGGIHQWSVRNNDHKKSVEILESSIIDMYLLSRCEFLLFQGNSSFSRIAAVMHGNEQKAFDWNAVAG
ncbi:MAG: hypothetical protein AAF564_04940 [Bacteroidota bacterium]